MNKVLIPELRFPEFLNEGNWNIEKLGEISEIVRGGSPRPIQDYMTNNKDGLNWLKIADVAPESKYITSTKEKVLKEALTSTREVSNGDLILSNSMSFGRPYILKIKTCIHDGWIAIRKISDITFEDYLYYFISSHSCQSYFQTNAAGAAVKNLNAEIIKRLPIYLPKKKQEQQKIASCLSSLDEVIATQSQKLELLRDHKKGLMQNLFPQEGKTAPKYRFPEFENDGKWNEKTLNEVATFLKGKGVSKSDIVENGRLPCIRYGELYTHYKETIGIIKSYTNLSADGLVMSKANDVIIPASGETQIDIATASCVLADGIALGGDLNIIRTKINGVFLSYLMNNVKKKEIAQLAQGISVVHLYSNQLKTLKINIPKPKEQQKIASCLSALDELIASQVKKIEHLKQHKKGLMQGLFPKIND
ncbi:restriction endonuclease subunit S [Flavobacterium sp. HSC-61S13]|uniref:restriction endonuclease subunit S n=1 Tax=Flavobacterium sp. HSC-61S13 TaxID=2910963 RepID=UPI00209E0D2C|nr:restriction endonuclease subunit S [Flavobacterium sp. HSC-61S13]MCP1994476.1 type I restriction enzyme S subunit [Flavobacterium sp. HSC-61S13]